MIEFGDDLLCSRLFGAQNFLLGLLHEFFLLFKARNNYAVTDKE
jgi:hypothetical protein